VKRRREEEPLGALAIYESQKPKTKTKNYFDRYTQIHPPPEGALLPGGTGLLSRPASKAGVLPSKLEAGASSPLQFYVVRHGRS
jgi:hypothetical protein